MVALRLALVLGLVFHKLVWELMKPRGKVAHAKQPPPPGFRKRLIKYAKAAVLLFFVFQTLVLELLPISGEPSGLQVAGSAIYLLGLSVAVIGRMQLGRNWANLEDFQVLPEQSLVRGGIYAYVRHPIYTGDILLLIGLQLALNSWLVLATLIPIAVVLKQALAEEALLSQKFDGYKEYCNQTKRFIPFIV